MTEATRNSGGSYVRNADGSETLVEQTGERPCACRAGDHDDANPTSDANATQVDVAAYAVIGAPQPTRRKPSPSSDQE